MALALKELFKALAVATKPLVRKDYNPERLAKIGFDEVRQANPYGSRGTFMHGEPSGIYYANNPKDMSNLMSGGRRVYRDIPNVEVLPLPEAKTGKFSADDWKGYEGEYTSDITQELKKKYDFVEFPDLATGQPELRQTVQLNPNKAVAKIKTDKGSVYKILGAGGLGLSAGTMFSPKDAEAFPGGNPLTQATNNILKKVFKEGVDSVPKEKLSHLFTTRNRDYYKLYRKDADPKRLLREGFREDLPGPLTEKAETTLASMGYSDNEISKMARGELAVPAGVDNTRDLKGLYWGSPKKVVASRIPEYGKKKGGYLQGIMDPNASFENDPSRAIIDALDLIANEVGDGVEVIQRRPNKILAKYGNTYKILGAAGAAAGAALSPDDAEAMPLHKPLKGVFKTFAEGMTSETRLGNEMRKIGQKIPAASSSSDRLVGMPLRGSKISGVYQGADDSRYIHLENGQIFPTTKESLHELSAERGTQQQIQKFSQLDEGARWEQISRSYDMNEAKGTAPRSPMGSKPSRIEILENSLVDRGKMLGSDLADQVLVQSQKSGKWWLWPRVYAEPAEVAGLVKIDRAKKTLFTNKEK